MLISQGFAKWAKFLSIIGFILCGLFVIVGMFAGTIFSSIATINRSMYRDASVTSGLGFVMTFVYICIAVVYFFPTLYLFQSSVKLKTALESASQELFVMGLAKLKACFRFWGIITIIILSIYALFFLIAILTFSRL